MQALLIQEWAYTLWKELNLHKGKVVLAFAVVTLMVVVLGLFWPKMYEASTVIYADQQNILQPLLAGSAEVTQLQTDQLMVIRERISSPPILEQVLLDTKAVASVNDKYTIEPLMRGLQSGIEVTEAGKNHIRIAYRSEDQNKAFAVATALTNVFLRDAASTKRRESRDAYTFIDNQVKTYKSQLQEAEGKLKQFKGDNIDGSEAGATSRIATLRSQIEGYTLELQVTRARTNELRQQLARESQYLSQRYKADVYRESLAQAQSKLDTLRLSYEDTYPDIVALKQQIQDMENSITTAENEPAVPNQRSAANPAYERLRSELAEAEVSVRTIDLRLNSSRKMLEDELSRSKRIAEHQAELSELTRDYTVTRSIYEDMLERKERARLSMALDIEGQGVTYKIKEPPVFPTMPVGLRFLHFFLAAPVLGVLVPIGLIVAYIQLDPRIRFADRLREVLPATVPVLGFVPYVSTPLERHVAKADWTRMALMMAAVLVVYALIAVGRLTGVL
jgi:polysaccharide chain length determinant protein (PEP-CTERM system associated)